MISQAQVLLARRQCGALAELVGQTPDGQIYCPTWFTTGSVAAERTGHRGALGMCDGLDLLRAHMQRKSWGIRRMAAFLPNQVGKSHHGSVVFPAAVFGALPPARIVLTGFGSDFISQSAPYVQWFMNRPEYREAYPDVRLGGVGTVDASDNAQRVDVLRRDPGSGESGWHKSGGSLICRSFGSAINGLPMDLGIMSDMYKGWQEALSPLEQRARKDFYEGVFVRRQQSKFSCMLLAFTPWTSYDVAYYVLDRWEKEGEPYLVVRYPTLSREDRRSESEQFRRGTQQREGLRKFVIAFTDPHIGPVTAPVGAEGQASPEMRPYDPRPLGGWLLPLADKDASFYEGRMRGAPARERAALDELDPDSAAAETFPRELWRYYDPREHLKFARHVIVCDPNKRETSAGAFASIGAWGLDLAATKGPDGKPLPPPVHPWLMHRRREARGRWAYSGLTRQLQDMHELFPEAKDQVLEHSAAGDSLAGDESYLRWLTARGITLWLAQPNGGFSKVKREGSKWTMEKVGTPGALAGGKEDWWPHLEAPLREGHLLLPRYEYGRDTIDWIADREDGRDESERQGWLTEFARAHGDGVVDRVDETAIMAAWARAHATVLSTWRHASGGR